MMFGQNKIPDQTKYNADIFLHYQGFENTMGIYSQNKIQTIDHHKYFTRDKEKT